MIYCTLWTACFWAARLNCPCLLKCARARGYCELSRVKWGSLNLSLQWVYFSACAFKLSVFVCVHIVFFCVHVYTTYIWVFVHTCVLPPPCLMADVWHKHIPQGCLVLPVYWSSSGRVPQARLTLWACLHLVTSCVFSDQISYPIC